MKRITFFNPILNKLTLGMWNTKTNIVTDSRGNQFNFNQIKQKTIH